MSPRVSVIVPTHDTIDLTLRCLAALDTARAPETEVILVDDASRDGTVDAVAARWPNVRVIRLDHCSGFARAANTGLRAAAGEILCLLNSDTEVDAGAIAALAAAFEADASLGIAGAALQTPEGEPAWSGGRAPTPLWLFVLASDVARHLARIPGYRRLRPPGAAPGAVDWVPGTALAMRRVVWERIGPLDASYRFYAQDVHLCLRARDLGWGVALVGGARVVHREGGTISRVSADTVRGQQLELLWTDLARVVERRSGRRAGRSALRALRAGLALRRLPRAALTPFVLGSRRSAWQHESRVLSATARALRTAARGRPPRRALAVARLSLLLAPRPSRAFRRRANRFDAWVQRSFGRSWSSVASGLPVLLLTTVGRRTGVPRTVALAYARVEEGLFVVGGDHGSPVDPAWVRNLRAQPDVAVEVGRRRLRARATPVEGPERENLWPCLLEQLPAIELYAERSGRELPVVRLDLEAPEPEAQPGSPVRTPA